MYELAAWIDKKLDDISKTKSFLEFFSYKILIEDSDIDSCYFINEAEGIDVMFSDQFVVTSIHLFSGKYSDCSKFKHALPFGVDFSFSRKKVREILGPPDNTCGDLVISFLGHENFWDKYFYSTYSIHFQFDKTESYIELLTIGSLTFHADSTPE